MVLGDDQHVRVAAEVGTHHQAPALFRGQAAIHEATRHRRRVAPGERGQDRSVVRPDDRAVRVVEPEPLPAMAHGRHARGVHPMARDEPDRRVDASRYVRVHRGVLNTARAGRRRRRQREDEERREGDTTAARLHRASEPEPLPPIKKTDDRSMLRRTVSTDLSGGARPRGCGPAGLALKRRPGHCVLRLLRDGSGCAARRQPARAGLAASASSGGRFGTPDHLRPAPRRLRPSRGWRRGRPRHPGRHPRWRRSRAGLLGRSSTSGSEPTRIPLAPRPSRCGSSEPAADERGPGAASRRARRAQADDTRVM